MQKGQISFCEDNISPLKHFQNRLKCFDVVEQLIYLSAELCKSKVRFEKADLQDWILLVAYPGEIFMRLLKVNAIILGWKNNYLSK